MENQTLKIKVSDIVESGKNPRGTMSEAGIKELAADIKVHGLINSITVRPKGSKYELIAGHRRLAAIKLNGDADVECKILNVNAEEAFEISVIENLQREEVHPMDEAIAFQTLISKSSIEQLGARIGKDAQYITRRLQLNNLIPEIQKLFREDQIGLMHCMEIARLNHDLQRTCIKEISDEIGRYGEKKVKYFKTVKELQYFIQTRLMNSLNAAPWKKDDALLYKKAGACNTCAKNTATNAMLFPEMANNAACLDHQCYATKSELFVKASINAMQDEGIDVHILTSNWYVDEELKKQFPGMKGYLDRDDVTEVKQSSEGALTGIMVDGPRKAQVVYFKLKTRASSGSSGEKQKTKELPAALQIKVINERLVRGVELDRLKVFPQLKDLFDKHPQFGTKKNKEFKALSADEIALFMYAVCEAGGYKFKHDDIFDIDKNKPAETSATLNQYFNDKELFAMFVRNFIHSQLSDRNVEKNPFVHDMYLAMAKHHGIKRADEIFAEQNEVKKKRIERSNKKIEELKGVKLPEKKKNVKEKIKAAGEKSNQIAAKQANEKLDEMDAAVAKKKVVKKPVAKKAVKKPVKKVVKSAAKKSAKKK